MRADIDQLLERTAEAAWYALFHLGSCDRMQFTIFSAGRLVLVYLGVYICM